MTTPGEDGAGGGRRGGEGEREEEELGLWSIRSSNALGEEDEMVAVGVCGDEEQGREAARC